MALELCVCTLKEMIPTRNCKGYTIGIDDKEILLQMALGLYHLHKNEIVHRDLKPENILFSSSTSMDTKLDVIKLSDFGISRIVCADKNRKKEINNEKLRRFGTDGWIPHEMYTHSEYTEKKGKAADVWSLGCLFAFTLLNGKHPFGQDVSSRIKHIQNKDPMDSSVNQPLIEKEALEIIKSMIHPDPDKRKTAKDLIFILQINILKTQALKQNIKISQFQQRSISQSLPSQHNTISTNPTQGKLKNIGTK